MAHIRRIGPIGHLRAEPNQHILHYRKGTLTREGPGLAYWFNPLSAAVAQVPVEDIETTFLLKERTRDLQEVTVQVVLTYRCAEPRVAAARVNFALALGDRGLGREAARTARRALEPAGPKSDQMWALAGAACPVVRGTMNVIAARQRASPQPPGARAQASGTAYAAAQPTAGVRPADGGRAGSQ